MTISNNQWKFIFGLAAAILGFALAQTDVVLDPAIKAVLVAALAGLAALNPNRTAG